MIIKTKYNLNNDIIAYLESCLGQKINYFLGKEAVLDSEGFLSINDMVIFVNSFANEKIISIGNTWQFYEQHGDDFSILRISGKNKFYNYDINRSIKYIIRSNFKIKEIKIFGQHRIRKWSQEFSKNQSVIDSIDHFQGHADEIYTIEIIELKSEENDYITLKSFRDSIHVTNGKIGSDIYDQTYRKGDLDLSYNWLDDQNETTDEKVYKLHYHIK